MSNNNQNQAMQRFFEFVFNVPGDCFCCTWSISCFLETVEHMEGDKRWRSICTLGMSLLSLVIVFLLTLALCPKFYWSEINQIVTFNSTHITPHINYSSSTYIPTMMYLNSTNQYENTNNIHRLLESPINNIDDMNNNNDIPFNLTKHTVKYEHIGLHLNLWHINYCTKSYINDTYYKTYYNDTNIKGRIFINNTNTITNKTCSFMTYRESGTTSSTQDLSLWFIIFVIALLLLGCFCILGTHPLFDKCHNKNTALRSSIQKVLAIAITILCACILNWSSFVFAAVFENQVEKYDPWQEKEPITQSNLGTGMLSVNGAMLLGIILSVIHCGAPIRSDANPPANNNNNNAEANGNDNDNENGASSNSDGQQLQEAQTQQQLSHQQRMLLRHIPGGNSTMNNMAILANPDNWFKSSNNNNNNNNCNVQNGSNSNGCDHSNGGVNSAGDVTLNVHVENGSNGKDNININNLDDTKEFDYQHMEDKSYNTNLSMKRIRKKGKKANDLKRVSLLMSDECDKENNINICINDGKGIMLPALTPITSIDSGNNNHTQNDIE